MGDPSNADVKFEELVKTIRRLWLAVFALAAFSLFLFALSLIIASQGGTGFIADGSVGSRDIIKHAVTESNVADNAISARTISPEVAGNGLYLTASSLELKTSESFWFDGGGHLEMNASQAVESVLSSANMAGAKFRGASFITGTPEFIASQSSKANTGDIVSEGSIVSMGALEGKSIKAESMRLEGDISADGCAQLKSIDVYTREKPIPADGEIRARAVTSERFQSAPGLAPNLGDIGVSGDILAKTLSLKAPQPNDPFSQPQDPFIVLDGDTGLMKGTRLQLGGTNAPRPGDIYTTGDIVSSGGSLDVALNVEVGGFIKANTLRLGLSSEVPTDSGEISANFITVNNGGKDKVEIIGHESKVSVFHDEKETIVLDGTDGSITLKDKNGQSTTLSVGSILEETLVRDFTVEGDTAVLTVREGNHENDDSMQFFGKGPSMKMSHRQGFNALHQVEVDAVHTHLAISRADQTAKLTADPPGLELSSSDNRLSPPNGVKFTVEDPERGNAPSLVMSKEGEEILVVDTDVMTMRLSPGDSSSPKVIELAVHEAPQIKLSPDGEQFVDIVAHEVDGPQLLMNDATNALTMKSRSLQILEGENSLMSIDGHEQTMSNPSEGTELKVSGDNSISMSRYGMVQFHAESDHIQMADRENDSLLLSVTDPQRGDKPSLVFTKDSKPVFELDTNEETLVFATHVGESDAQMKLHAGSATMQVSNGADTTKVSPSSIAIGADSAMPLVLTTATVQIDSHDLDHSACQHKGQLIIGRGKCLGGTMTTAIWVGICSADDYLQCPLPIPRG